MENSEKKITIKHVLMFVFWAVVLADAVMLYLKFFTDESISSGVIAIFGAVTVSSGILAFKTPKEK